MDGSPNYSTFCQPCSVAVGRCPKGSAQTLWVTDCGPDRKSQQLRQAVLVPPSGTPITGNSLWHVHTRKFGELVKTGIDTGDQH